MTLSKTPFLTPVSIDRWRMITDYDVNEQISDSNVFGFNLNNARRKDFDLFLTPWAEQN